MTSISSWWGRGRKDRIGTGQIKQLEPETAAENPAIAPPGGVTRPEPDPKTGKVYPPGKRLEKQAREYARTQEPAKKPRKKRNYDALIARALEEMTLK